MQQHRLLHPNLYNVRVHHSDELSPVEGEDLHGNHVFEIGRYF